MTTKIKAGVIGANIVTGDSIADNSIGAGETDLSIVQGDVIYGTGADAWARLAKGTANQHLAMNSGATALEWQTPASSVQIYMGAFTRLAQAASGNVAYTGVGFQPDMIQFISAIDQTHLWAWSFTEGTTNYGISVNNLTPYMTVARSFIIDFGSLSGASQQRATIDTMDSDGFSLDWIKVNSPQAVTIQVRYMAFKF